MVFMVLCMLWPALVTNIVDAVTATEMKSHLTSTFANYDTRIRPIINQTVTLEVTVDFHMIGVNDLDSGAEKLDTTAYLEITWVDEVLARDWSDAAIDDILVPQTDVWLPDLALQNGFTSLTGLGNSFHNVKVMKTGQVTWRPYHVFKSACSVDVTYFPFDRTTCDMKFIVWSTPKDLVHAEKGTMGLDMTSSEENSEWTTESTEAQDFTTDTSSGVVFSLELKRKPLFYLLNILVPVVMLAAINPFVFALPTSSGAKIGYAITTFLAFAVFLTIVSSVLPQNSEKISTFAAYLFLMTFLSTVMSLVTIVQLRLASRDSDVPVPAGLQRMTRSIRRLTLGNCSRKNGGYIRGLAISETKRRVDADVSWEDTMDALDFILFWIFFLITFFVTMICFVLAAVAALS